MKGGHFLFKGWPGAGCSYKMPAPGYSIVARAAVEPGIGLRGIEASLSRTAQVKSYVFAGQSLGLIRFSYR